MSCAVSPATSTDVYRRAARRLRCRLAGDPARMQRSLKALADRTPVRVAAEHEDESVVLATVPTSAAQLFSEHLATHAPAGVLRYSQRLELLRAARQFGIGRFQANLLIAAVVDRQSRNEGAVATNDAFVGNLVTFLVVQGAVLLGAWWMLFR